MYPSSSGVYQRRTRPPAERAWDCMRATARLLVQCARWAGRIVKASTSETTRQADTTSGSGRRKRPVVPVSISTGRNAAMLVRIVAITARPTSAVPSTAATSGASPSSIRR